MIRIEVPVTQAHIDKGRPGYTGDGPLSLAVIDAVMAIGFGFHANVGIDVDEQVHWTSKFGVSITRGQGQGAVWFPLSQEVADWDDAYGDGEDVKPFTFIIEGET